MPPGFSVGLCVPCGEFFYQRGYREPQKQLTLKKAPRRAPSNYSAFGSVGLVIATVSPASPTLNRANRRTAMFSPSLPIFEAIS